MVPGLNGEVARICPMKADHRKPQMPHWDVAKGQCRWCGDFIWKNADTLDFRKHWHPHCVDAYKEAAWPQYARMKVYERDQGRCTHCSKTTKRAWELDHIVPLIEGGGFELSNMQTLCRRCHRTKTAAEAKNRAEKRRIAEPKPSDTIS